MNQFGGDWTKAKIEILVEYAKAYLVVMHGRNKINIERYGERYQFKLMYFDGFAGSGEIIRNNDSVEDGSNVETTIGAARRIIEIETPIPFDRYYFVEKDTDNYTLLEERTKLAFPGKKINTFQGDCNEKLVAMSRFLKQPENKSYRTLAYIDPCGMQVNWASMESMKNLPIDVWALVPTGMGVVRLLKNDGQITDAWLTKLELFLGMSREDIKNYFYKRTETLFEDYPLITKESFAVTKSANLYRDKLKEIFSFVSEPYELKNSVNSVMYHLYFATNNKAGVTIANDIVKKYSSQ